MTTNGTRTLWVQDFHGNWAQVARCRNVTEGRQLWIELNKTQSLLLDRFQVRNYRGRVVYEGNYNTDPA